MEGLRTRIRNHIAWAREAQAAIAALPGFEIVTPCRFSLFTFRHDSEAATRDLLDRINADGRTYLTQTVHEGQFVIRFQVGQFDCTRADVMMAVSVLAELTA
ncbi:MAG: aromatic-L-amino-acid decarboxylase [Maricaulis sp.]